MALGSGKDFEKWTCPGPVPFSYPLNCDFDPADTADEQKRVVARALADARVSKSLKDAFNKVNNDPKHTADELEAVRAPLLAERKAYVDKAQAFFQYSYNWASDNYSQSSATPDDPPQTNAPEFPDQQMPPPPAPPPPGVVFSPPAPPAIAMGLGGRIMHPDHHDSNSSGSPPTFDPNAKNGREAHNGHYHIQIGPTHGTTADEPALT